MSKIFMRIIFNRPLSQLSHQTPSPLHSLLQVILDFFLKKSSVTGYAANNSRALERRRSSDALYVKMCLDADSTGHNNNAGNPCHDTSSSITGAKKRHEPSGCDGSDGSHPARGSWRRRQRHCSSTRLDNSPASPPAAVRHSPPSPPTTWWVNSATGEYSGARGDVGGGGVVWSNHQDYLPMKVGKGFKNS